MATEDTEDTEKEHRELTKRLKKFSNRCQVTLPLTIGVSLVSSVLSVTSVAKMVYG